VVARIILIFKDYSTPILKNIKNKGLDR
jgi:hypothetical protein